MFLDASSYYSGRPGFNYNYSTLTSWDGYWFEDRLNGCSGIEWLFWDYFCCDAEIRGLYSTGSSAAARRDSYMYELAEYGYRISDYCFAPRGAIYCLTSGGLYWIPGDPLPSTQCRDQLSRIPDS